jgi:hypothetical protein
LDMPSEQLAIHGDVGFAEIADLRPTWALHPNGADQYGRITPNSGRPVSDDLGHNRKKRLALVHNRSSSACRCIPS